MALGIQDMNVSAGEWQRNYLFKFLILSEPFSLDNGTLTQTMKLKRKIVLDRLNDQIEALYKK